MIKNPVVSRLLLVVAMLLGGTFGLLAGVYVALHLGLALGHGYDYFLIDSRVGTALILGVAALGALLPLAARALWMKRRAQPR